MVDRWWDKEVCLCFYASHLERGVLVYLSAMLFVVLARLELNQAAVGRRFKANAILVIVIVRLIPPFSLSFHPSIPPWPLGDTSSAELCICET